MLQRVSVNPSPARACASPSVRFPAGHISWGRAPICKHKRASDAPHAAAVPVETRPQTEDVASSRRVTHVSPEARRALFSTAAEQVVEVEAVVSGTIPEWVQGALLMNGGGAYHSSMLHMFDGFGLIAKLRVEGGRVWGSQRFVQSQAYTHFARTGKMKWREFASPLPADSPFDVARGMLDTVATLAFGGDAFTDNASVNLLPLPDGTVIASSETIRAQYRVDPSRLETLGQVRYDAAADGVAGDLTTAHPKVLADGTIVNFVRNLPNGGFNIFKQDPHTLKRTLLATIKDREPLAPAWVHDMCCSGNHLVICETPLLFNLGSLVLGTRTPYLVTDWKPELGTLVHIVALDGSGVRTFEAPPFFVFHYVNAHEAVLPSGARMLHVDMCMFENPDILNDLLLDRLAAYPGAELSEASLRRLSIPLDETRPSDGSSSRRLGMPVPLAEIGAAASHFFEFPCVAPGRYGQPYRFAYGTTAMRPTNMGNALNKVDVTNGSATVWHEPGGVPGEPAFVARPGGTVEDDGVLLSNVTLADGRSALVVLDAKNLKELARATLPFAIPYRFHNAWLAGQAQI